MEQGRGQWKMITDNSRTHISEPSSNKTEKRNISKDQTVLEKSLDELESIQTEDEVKNVLVTIINLVIHSRDAKAVVRNLWKAIELHEQHYNIIQRE
jgi:pyruvate-formate lyase